MLSAMRRKSFSAEKWWQLRKIRNQLGNRSEAIVVHQMSKVGSSTVVSSISASAPDVLVLHTHFLSEEGLDWLQSWVRERWGTIHVPQHLWHGLFARNMYANDSRQSTLKIISLVRDPVARTISEFFEELDVHANYPYAARVEKLGIDAVVAELEKMLLDRMKKEVEWAMPYEWFDKEIRDVFDVDLFEQPFDPDSGYAIYTSGRVQILLLKLERLADCAGEAFARFLGIRNVSLDEGRNIASRKYYADAYRLMLNRLEVPASVLATCYASDQVRHFYSESDIERFLQRWQS